MTSERYSSTLASSWIGMPPEPGTVSKEMKKRQASGKMK